VKSLNKKAQEEMVGFVLIMIIVAIVILILLGIMLSKNNSIQKTESSERVGSFLKSISYYTTNCENPPTVYNNIEDLIKLCNDHESCSDGRQACDVLKNDLSILLNGGFLVKNGSFIKGYNLMITTGENESKVYFIEPISKGSIEECKDLLYYDRYFIGIDNDPIMALEVCYNSEN